MSFSFWWKHSILPKKYPPEVCDRAARIALDGLRECESVSKATKSRRAEFERFLYVVDVRIIGWGSA
jgi:hypothetical protein